jgi:GAF domain-containing protein
VAALPDQDLRVLALPLRAHGRRIGSLNIFRLWPGGGFSQEDQRFLQDLADRAALAIEDALLFEREAQRARELQALHKAANMLLSTLDLDALLKQIMESAALAIPAAQHGVLYLLEDDGELLTGATFGGLALSERLPGLQESAARAARDIQPARIELAAVPRSRQARRRRPGRPSSRRST